MSFDAVTWAKAQRLPGEWSQPVKARAKAVLAAFAAYVDARGRGWAAIDVLSLETELERRTVMRGLADLKACGLLQETGDQEVYKGKCYPIFQLPLGRGPSNTRDRLREDRAAGVTPVSPQDQPGEAWGDTGDTSWGDIGDQLGVTPETPKQEVNQDIILELNPKPRAREAAARLAELEGLAPASILRFYDQPAALAAMLVLIDKGFDVAQLAGAMQRMAAHPVFRSRRHPPQLHDWLKKRGFTGWLKDDPPDLFAKATGAEPPAAAPVAMGPGVADEATQATWRVVLDRARDALVEGEFAYVARAYVGRIAGELYLVAATSIAKERIRDRMWRRVSDWWRAADSAGRTLTLMSKIEFEAALSREGV